MKKYMNMPDVKIVRFENKDVVCTSGEPTGLNETNEAFGKQELIQERRSIWE